VGTNVWAGRKKFASIYYKVLVRVKSKGSVVRVRLRVKG
jgi:hypothetical protein